MKNIGRRILCLLFVASMLLSMVAVPGMNAQATEEQSEWVGHDLFDYNYTCFAGGGNVQAISDADAYQGNAKIYTGLNLDQTTIPLYRYEANNPEHQYGFLKLGEVAKEDLKVDQGYQAYSFTTTLPAEGMLTNGNYVYFTDGCTIQNATMAKDLKTLAGKTVTITMSMKITGQLSSATVYVDRMQIKDSCEDHLSADGTYCTACGKSMVDTSLPTELQTVDTTHIDRYNYADFDASAGGAIVEDTDSPIGQAFSHTMSVASGIDIYRYAPSGADYAHQYMELAKIPAAGLAVNDGYHFYKSTVTVPEDIADPGSYVYVNWYCRNTALCNDLIAYAGKTVDFYISMKITGTDLASIQVYVDQMIVASHCEDYQEGNACSLCGKVLSEPETTEPETTEPETTEPFGSHDLFDYNHTSFAGGANVQQVSDADAYQETAKIYTGVNLDKASVPLYRYEANNPEHQYGFLKLGAIAREDFKVDQGYQTYSFTTTIPAEGLLSDGNYVYLTDDCVIQNAQMAKDIKTLAGKTVTITMSMKITGQLSSATVYVDRMQIQDSCEDNLSEDGTYCTVCGKSMVDTSLPEDVQTVDPQHIIRYNYADFDASAGGAIVEDADSPIGQTFSHTMSVASGIDIYRYAPDGADLAHQYMELAKIPAADLKINDGYHFYKSTVTVPDDIADPGSYVYVNWFCRNTALCNDLVAYAGKTVDFYISMKITGTDLANVQVDIDQMILVDLCENHNVDNTCSVCGKVLSGTEPTEPETTAPEVTEPETTEPETTEPETTEPETTEPETTEPLAHHVLFDYNYTHFSGSEDVQNIRDADAYMGTAKVFTGVNLDKASIPLYRYEPGNPEFRYEYLKLGAIAKEEFKVDQGYQTYSIKTTLPAEGMLSDGNTVYFTDNWTIKNAQMAKDLKTLAGKTVAITISMKITGELGSATVYVDRMQIKDFCEDHVSEDGTHCTVCGKNMVEIYLPEELESVDAQHIHGYNHSKFSASAGGAIVEDADSPIGQAFSHTISVKNGIEIYRYAQSGADFAHQYLDLAKIPAADIVMNDGYHFYKSTVNIPADITDPGSFVYVNWHCRNTALCNDLTAYAGKTVDFFISMKVTGEDPENAQVFIDQMILVDRCENYNVDDVCSVCGKDLSAVQPTEPTEPQKSHVLFDYNHTSFAGGAEPQDVADTDAYQGTAKVYTGVNLDKASIPLYRYEAGNPLHTYGFFKLGAITKEALKVNQGYHTYSFTKTIPAEGLLTNGNYVYLTDDCTIQNAAMAKDLKTLAGKTVTITMSMKITGELANATVYVDRMQIMDSCVDHPNADGTHCTVCGGELPSIEPTVPETVPVAGPTEPLAPHELFAYDFNNFAGSADAQVVGDRDAYRDIAMVFTGVNLDKPSVPLYRYEKGNPVFSYEYLKLGAIARESFRLDQGYQTYSITTTIPAEGLLTDGNHVYFTDNWTIQNAQMAKDLKTLAGKTVAITMSMKITGSLSNATVYVDRMQIKDFCEDHLSADETHCTVCGKNMAQISLPDELKDVDSQHIQGYNYSKFSVSAGGAIVEDADSPIGQAFSHTMSVKSGIEIYRYAQSGADFSHQYLELAKIPAANIVMNDGYHFYRSTVTVPEDIVNPGSFVYVNWHCRNTALCDDLAAYAGKTVDFFISMKVTGEDPENAQVFIDQMILVDRCENYNVDDVCSVCGKSVSGIITNPVSHDLFDYNHTNFAGGGNVQEIADSDAYQGTAKIYTGLNLDKPSIPLYRYEAGNPEFEYGYLWLGAIARADLIVDQGYYTYSFTTTIPEEGLLTDGNYVYLTDECTIQNAQMARNLKALAGKTVTIKLSMKIVGPLSNATVYVDRMQILESCTDFASEDGTTCTKCGKPIVPEEEALPIPEIVDFVYTADDFTLALSETNGDCVMEDSTSAQGKAAVLSYKARMEKDNSVKDLIRTDSQTLKLYIYGGDPAQSRLIHEFTVDQLKENAAGGKYVEYTVRDIDLIPTNDNYYFYMFDSWCFKLNLPTTHQRAIHKQGYVDVTISMKITGDVTGKGTPPAYYIDKIAIKAAESGKVIHRHEYKEWTAEQLTHSATCLSCGETTTQFHKWDAGVVTKEYTGGEKGERLYTCTVCGATKTEQFDNRVRLVFHADSFHLPSKGDSIVKDSSAPHGMAALFSTANRLASGSSIKDLQRKDAQRLSIYSYGGNPKESRLIGELDVNYLEKTIWSGKYITYKFKGADAFPTAGTYFLYMFDGWGFQIPLNQSQVNSMIGKTMDLFLTIKVTGDLTGYVNYYIDEVILQETSSEGDHLIPDVPKRKIPRVIDSLPAEYFAEDFRLPLADFGSGDVVVEDPTSAYGKAVMLSYESRKAYDGEGKSMIREPGKLLRLYTDTAILIGEWTSAQLQENAAGGEYVLYEFKNVNLTGAKFMYMFDCWGFQIPMEKLTDALSGVNVDVKVSMKVTGDVTSREENTPAYYIDYISITESAPIPEHEHVYENWITDVLNHKAACTVCGIRLEGFHVWDDGVVTKEATATEDGEIVYTCKICKMEDVKKIKKKPNAAVEEPEPENHGILIGVVAAGLIAIVIAVVAVLLLVKKPNKPSKTTEKPTQEEHDETT